jgi:fluoride exporter
MSWLLIAIGSALGGVARHAVGLFVTQKWGSVFPWGTLTVNVVGSFSIGVLGALVAVSQRTSTADAVRELLMIGFLGGFTTFSAFSLQTLQLMRDGRPGYALANVSVSIAACLLAVWLGYVLGQFLSFRSGQSP